MSTPVHVYILQSKAPWKAPECFSAWLKTTKSGATWAIVDRLNGRRFKLGSTAFLSPEAANLRRLGKCAQNLQPRTVDYLQRKGFDSVLIASASQLPPKVYRNQMRM